MAIKFKSQAHRVIFTDPVMRNILTLIKNGANFDDLERETGIPAKKIRTKLLLTGNSIAGLGWRKAA